MFRSEEIEPNINKSLQIKDLNSKSDCNLNENSTSEEITRYIVDKLMEVVKAPYHSKESTKVLAVEPKSTVS